MRYVALIATLSSLGVASAVGCGGGSSFNGNGSAATGGSGSNVGPALEQVPELYAEGMCSALTQCNPLAGTLLIGANDCTKLIAAEVTNASLPAFQAAVAAGTVSYTSSAASGCRDALAASGCSFANNPYLPACEAALSGKVEEGHSCAINEECRDNLYCKYNGTCPGTCAQLEAEGGLCRSAKDCQSGLACFVTTGTTGKCTVKPTLGQGCGFDVPGDCAPQANDAVICWGASSTKEGKCMAVNAIASQAVNSTCSILAGSLCVSGASCHVTSILLTGTCVAAVASAGSCTFAFPDPCPQEQYCTATGPDAPGSCSLLPTAGQPCLTGVIQTFSNRVCAADHVCLDGTCIKYRANGESCTSNAVCYSGRCDSQSQQCVPNQNCSVAPASN